MRITGGQIQSWKSAISEIQALSRKDVPAMLYITGRLIGRELEALGDLTKAEWIELRDQAYPNWQDDDWTVSPDFRVQIAEIYDEYRETVLGQKRLF